ncbi:hypothetical protein ScPMuIL_014347 [Solemya velum]
MVLADKVIRQWRTFRRCQQVHWLCMSRIHSNRPDQGSALTDPENKGHYQRGVNFDTLGSWNNRLDMPIQIEQSIKSGLLIPKIPLNEIGYSSLIGRRKVNEDRFITVELTPDILYFGIFDGHNGGLAADYTCQFLHQHIKFWMSQIKDLHRVLWNAFLDCHNVLARHLVFYNIDSDDFSTGTTATVCLLRNGLELIVAHVGDSRAILSREGMSIRLSKDHEPDHNEERQRIEQHGGVVSCNSLGVPLVNGRLAMTRSIGDVELKQYGVVATPYIRSIQVKHGKDAALILNSDGIHFVLSDQEVVDIVNSCRVPSEAANILTDQALQFGSDDNATSMVIPFGAWGKDRKKSRLIPYSFGRNLVSGRFS